MVDVVDKSTRSRMMSGIRGKNTKPELQVRSALHAEGLRFRLHVLDMPGKPDIVFPKYRAVVFVHGCFWHGHMCRLFKFPSTRSEFWENKIMANVKRDQKIRQELIELGWRVSIVWECATKGKSALEVQKTITPLANWLRYSMNINELEILA